jgi:hypothetical protein
MRLNNVLNSKGVLVDGIYASMWGDRCSPLDSCHTCKS